MEDNQIIDLYWKRSEDAIVQTDIKYGGFCRTIAFNILNDRLDSEECVNDAYLRTWNAIPPQRPGIFSAFLGRITRNLSLDRFRREHAQIRGGSQTVLALEELGECVSDEFREETHFERKAIEKLLNDFLGGLKSEQRNIFLLRYWYLCPVKDIAQKLNISESKVKMTLLRSRETLRRQMEAQGVSV